jgi:hypothetical protein
MMRRMLGSSAILAYIVIGFVYEKLVSPKAVALPGPKLGKGGSKRSREVLLGWMNVWRLGLGLHQHCLGSCKRLKCGWLLSHGL